MKRSTSTLVCIGMVALNLLPGTGLAVQGGGISAFPTKPNLLDDYGTVWFRYHLSRGQERQDSITVVNDSDTTKNILVYPVDASATLHGNLSMRNQNESRTEVGRWVKLADTTLSLGPKERRAITFMLAIPPDAPVGDHVGGIVVQEQQYPTVATREGVHIQVISRLAVRIYETIPGLAQISTSLDQFRIEHPKRLIVKLTLKNTGNMTIEPVGALTLKDRYWGKPEQIKLPPITLLPGHKVELTLASKQVRPLIAIGTAKLNLSTSTYHLDRSLAYHWVNTMAILVIGLALFMLIATILIII